MENTPNMDQFSSSGFENDDETRALISLLSAFGSVCSLDEIADAYCKGERDVNRTGEILCQLQTSKSNGDVQGSNKGLDHPEPTQSLHGHTVVETTLPDKNSKGKSSKACASLGTVSSVMGRTYCKTTPSLNETSRTSKPLIVEMKGSIEEDHEIDLITSRIADLKASIHDKDVEEFLFSMLGDGFQLRKDVIREVLGQCGYNVKDSMEELLALSNKSMDKQRHLNCDTAQNVTGENLEIKACGSSQSHLSSSSGRNSTEQSNLDEEKSSLSREILESLFHAPPRSDQEPRKRLEWGLNRTRVAGQQIVSKPLEAVPQPPLISIRHIRPDFENTLDENDQYSLLRKAAKQHWSTMKEYYVAAVDAFNDGDRAKANYLLEQGKYYNQLAREADEKSQQEILNMKSSEQCDFPLDLHEHNPKEAVKLLKVHIRSLASMPSFRYLKVVLETDAMDAKNGRRRRSVTRFLEKDLINWTEEDGNPGTILIKLDEINLDKLSQKNDSN
ncbi:putative nuclear RNA export factor SDE5 isoform X1 [Dioscorea cayenensis subsp. rotundata]|uniref:Nuclear RNA export factor SDE5 isoform X1 n=1 Tax=Dioscorea cayennensis subsp. rotundata TaxID=55577 RepID=A0AB40CK46_DIOCR|nr:putative nuclear RNA export factor SDE5 isoform X1 [Dioscorea cayenensis subsp. rotundata]XP_039139127.1 putative nuclear RNA export factor SDE5 isoform X1 [Dioscorea cayenensis subsp. rotundata]